MSAARSSGWARGGAVFAAAMALILGMSQAFRGIAAIAEDDVFVSTPNYTFSLDVTAWGWIHLVIGILLVVTGIAIGSGKIWAFMVGVGVAMLSAFVNFLNIPAAPLWSIVLIALDILVIWALTTVRPEDV